MKHILIILLSIFLSACSATIPNKEKINGVSFVASNEAVDQSDVVPVIELNANYAAIMPFGFMQDLNSREVYYNSNKQWFGETREGSKQYISELQKNNIKIMLKPQIWIWRGEFTGNIMMASEEDWETLEQSYSKFILDYAKLAEEIQADIFCIGTELELFVKYRPNYWIDLINRIRSYYKGKLTYAANWDEYRRVPFWKELDYVGIDAYFPLSNEKTPTVENLRIGWDPFKQQIKELQKKTNRPILFTEYGYRSTYYTAKEPWVSDYKIKEVDHDAQINALQALFDEFWNEDWFAGGFLWKWFHAHDRVGGENNAQFTPQNKPAESIVRDNYAQY